MYLYQKSFAWWRTLHLFWNWVFAQLYSGRVMFFAGNGSTICLNNSVKYELERFCYYPILLALRVYSCFFAVDSLYIHFIVFTSILKSLVILAIRLALSDAIHSQIAPFLPWIASFSQPMRKQSTNQTWRLVQVTNQIAGIWKTTFATFYKPAQYWINKIFPQTKMSLSDLNQTPTHARLILKSRVWFWTKLHSSCSIAVIYWLTVCIM